MAALLWWTSVFLAASVLVTVFASEGTVVITHCQNGTTTHVEDSNVYLYCYDLTHADGDFLWALTTEDGKQIQLGTCPADNSCTSYVPNTRVERSTAATSRCAISDIPRNMTGDITCTVRTQSGQVGIDTCRVNIVRISFSKPMIDKEEGKLSTQERVNFSPTGLTSITLTLTTDSGVIPLGNCTTGQYQCTPDAGLYEMTFYPAHLSFTSKTPAERRDAGYLGISVSYGNETEKAKFPVNVYSPPKVDNCSIAVHGQKGKAELSCDISHAFSTAEVYTFQVLEFSPTSSFIYKDDSDGLRIAKNSSELKRHTKRSFSPYMKRYTNTTDNKAYYGGRLQYSWKLSSFNKAPMYVSILVCTASSVYRCTYPDPWFVSLPKGGNFATDHQDGDNDDMEPAVIGLGVTLALVVIMGVILMVAVCMYMLRNRHEGNYPALGFPRSSSEA